MNSFHLARNLSKRSQTLVYSRFFSKGAIPTSSAVEIDGTKVVGLPHLSVRYLFRVEVMLWLLSSLMLTSSASPLRDSFPLARSRVTRRHPP